MVPVNHTKPAQRRRKTDCTHFCRQTLHHLILTLSLRCPSMFRSLKWYALARSSIWSLVAGHMHSSFAISMCVLIA